MWLRRLGVHARTTFFCFRSTAQEPFTPDSSRGVTFQLPNWRDVGSEQRAPTPKPVFWGPITHVGLVHLFVYLCSLRVGDGIVPWPMCAGVMVLVLGLCALGWSAVVFAFLEYLAIDELKCSRAPGPSGDRGCTPRWGLMAGYAACCTQYIRYCPMVPVQVRFMEPPATTVGEWWRHHSL